MNTYELMIKTNHFLIKGGTFTEKQKQNIVKQFMSAVITSDKAQKFYRAVRFPGNIDQNGRRMYPIFFLPPYNNGNKLKTIFNQTPKTHILSANMYELEIIRILHILDPENETVKEMVEQSLRRLRTTCFGNEDGGEGECFDTSIVVLRFLAQVAPSDTKWIKSRIDNYNNHVDEKKRPWFSKWYFWLCLSELPFDIAKPEIEKYMPTILNWLCKKSCVMNSEHDKTIHPVLFFMLRNILVRFPEYEYIKNRQPYIGEKDGRLYFDMSIQ
ncbi:MAG: hypothetical protein JXQ23_10970 [Clostridia bacterium]|nr:hypothetical protein [Clostridia bacterium]